MKPVYYVAAHQDADGLWQARVHAASDGADQTPINRAMPVRFRDRIEIFMATEIAGLLGVDSLDAFEVRVELEE